MNDCYVIKYHGRNLSSFFPNDIPNKTKSGGVSVKNILSFSNWNYMIFPSFEEAEDEIRFILREINYKENYERYNEVHPHAKEALINIIENMKISKE